MSHLLSRYGKLVHYGLKDDIVGAIFIFGWFLSLFSVEILSFQFGRLTAQFYEILPERRKISLISALLRFTTFLVMMAMGKGTLFAVKGLLSRAIRKNLMSHLHSQYLTLQGIQIATPPPATITKAAMKIDHPDQRITDDVENFSINIVQVAEILLVCPVLIVFYNAQLNAKLSTLSVVLIYAHFMVSLLVLRLGMGKLRELTVKSESRGADLRAEHVSLASNAEAFHLINSQSLLDRLQSGLNEQVRRLLFTTKHLILTESLMELGKTFFTYSGALLNFLLMAAELTWGRWKSETDVAQVASLISLTSFLSLYLIFTLSRLAGIVDLLGVLNGQVERLTQLSQAIDSENNRKTQQSRSSENYFKITFKNFNYTLQNDHKQLYKHPLNFSIEPNQHTLLLGKNGSGKTSIIRFISGLWRAKAFNGHNINGGDNITEQMKSIDVTKPKQEYPSCRPFFMTCPQNPTFFSGSLFDLLALQPEVSESRASKQDEESCESRTMPSEELKEQVREALTIVGLDPNVLEGLFTTPQPITTWQTILTPGQHHRLCLARALIHRPHLLILDETFTSMNPQEAEQLMAHIIKDSKTTILCIDSSSSFANCSTFKQTITINNTE